VSRADELRSRMGAAIQRAPATEQPAPRARPPRVKPVRITVDLDPGDHRALKLWALQHADGAALADVVRVMVAMLDTDPDYASRVADGVRERREP